jgi:hypothetical protein
MTRYLLLFDSYGLVFVGRPLWREDGSVFVYSAGRREHSLSQVRVPWDSWPYFTVSGLRLPFSSPPILFASPYIVSGRTTENTSVSLQWTYANHIENTSCDTGSSIVTFTATLHSNGSYLIVTCVFVAAGMCLPSRCLAVGLHVKIFKETEKRVLCVRRLQVLHLPMEVKAGP